MIEGVDRLFVKVQRRNDLRILLRGTAFVVPCWLPLTASILAMLAHTGTVVAAPWLVKLVD